MAIKLFFLAIAIWCLGTYYIWLMDKTHRSYSEGYIHILTFIRSCIYIFIYVAAACCEQPLVPIVVDYVKEWLILAFSIARVYNFNVARSERPYLKLKDVKTYTAVGMPVSDTWYEEATGYYSSSYHQRTDWNVQTDTYKYILVHISLPAYIWLKLKQADKTGKEKRNTKLKNHLHIIEAAQHKAKTRLRDIDAENEKTKQEIVKIITRIGG